MGICKVTKAWLYLIKYLKGHWCSESWSMCAFGGRERTGNEEGGKQKGPRRHEWNLP